MSLSINWDNLSPFISPSEWEYYENVVAQMHNQLHNKEGQGSDYLGWLNLPTKVTEGEINKITDIAKELRTLANYLVVIGIGGSYLGARAVIEALTSPFTNFGLTSKNGMNILYAGFNLGGSYHHQLLELLKKEDFCINVISKSGTTTEPGVVFRLLRKLAEEKYSEESAKRIVATTDENKGALLKLSKEKGYKTLIIPDDVGGRYSVLTPVGLLPIAAAGLDIKQLLKGAADMQKQLENPDLSTNLSYQYAVARHILYQKGINIEVLASMIPDLTFFAEWWKQLYGESEGKDNKGLFPASVTYTTDLHSLGQFMQDGKRIMFETFLAVEEENRDVSIPSDKGNYDNLNYLADKKISYINQQAYEGTRSAHTQGRVPNLTIKISKLDEYHLGQLIFFFEKACAMSGYLLQVNPFDQPGVELYKKEMFRLLGKPK